MRVHLNIWRQAHSKAQGSMERYTLDHVNPHMSFLEMLDVLNEQLLAEKKDPVAFDHDCREGICGACSMVINGSPHGGQKGTTTCQLHMRHFQDDEEIFLEPWRAQAFPVVKDLVTDRSSLDRILEAGGYVSVSTGSAPEAHSILVSKDDADLAMDGASCIGCGACVAACKNASPMLFLAAKIGQLAHTPQGNMETPKRVLSMVEQMDKEGFGPCSQTYECEAICPKHIQGRFIPDLHKLFRKAILSKP